LRQNTLNRPIYHLGSIVGQHQNTNSWNAHYEVFSEVEILYFIPS
jgi:hypothetical protein